MNAKEIIDKLQGVDVRDLKNIDFGQVQSDIKSKPGILIIIVLIVASLSATIYLYIDSRKNIADLDQQFETFTQQLAAADDNKRIKKIYTKFTDEFPESIIVDDMVDKLSVFAINHNIKIISFSPAKERSTDHTRIASINIMIRAEQYDELIDFLKDIENAPYAIRIERWSASLNSGASHSGSRRGRRQQTTQTDTATKPFISANIDIAAIALIEDSRLVKNKSDE